MVNFTNVPARTIFDKAKIFGKNKIFDKTSDQYKTYLDYRDKGLIITSAQRRRPRYFDGRFLAARDLTREQTYFLTRQSDLGKIVGHGVIQGLTVDSFGASSLQIASGHGITPSGEIVVLPNPLNISLADIHTTQRLNAAFGLRQTLQEPARNRSGLYVLALRPVEFTANPIVSYPTSIDGQRSKEDGDIIEGVAVTLIPYPDQGSFGDFEQRRSRVAREIFVEGIKFGFPANALPLAMIAVSRNIIQWLDPFLVRREVGAENGDGLSLSAVPQAVREAYILQYQQHLQEVLANISTSFVASDHFSALPPIGPFPRSAIYTASSNFTQTFFPTETDVDLSIIPEDEIPALIQDSLLLPPIDLTLTEEELKSTSILVLIPVKRSELRELQVRLQRFSSSNVLTPTSPLILKPLIRSFHPAAPGLVARRTPFEVLKGLTLNRFPPLLDFPKVNPNDLVTNEWRNLLSRPGNELLWYVRRRNFQIKDEIKGFSVQLFGDEEEKEKDLNNAINGLGVKTRFDALKNKATSAANAEIVRTLASPPITGSRTLLLGALKEYEGLKKFNHASSVKISTRFSYPALGEGLTRLETSNPILKTNKTHGNTLAASGRLPELDELAGKIENSEIPNVAKELETVVKKKKPALIKTFIEAKEKEFQERKRKRGPEFEVFRLLDTPQAISEFETLKRKASDAGNTKLINKLSSPILTNSKTILIAALEEFKDLQKPDAVSTEKVLDRFADVGAGEGLARLETTKDTLTENKTIFSSITRSGAVPELDRLGRLVEDTALPKLAKELENVAKKNKPNLTATFIRERLEELERRSARS